MLAPSPATQWFPCPNCHAPVPVVPPRDLPPLYSWEVVPGLYPQLAYPRRPRWRPVTVATFALAAAAVLSAVAGGLLAYEGYVGAQPAQYVVSGTVFEQTGNVFAPAPGATVILSSNGAIVGTRVTGPGGAFSFPDVPAGGIELNVSASGYAPVVVYTFACPSYATQTRGLDLTLVPGTVNNTSVTALTPFGDLETFLAYSGGAAVLLGAATATAGVAAIAVRRPGGAVAGVVGAGAAVAVPLVLLVLYVGALFPAVTALAGAAGGAGGFALVLASAEVASRDGDAPAGGE